MTRFYAVRHGYSEANDRNLIAGQAETPLTELGREQARLAGIALRDVRFDLAYSSDLSRAYETAQLATEGRIKIIKNEKLREIACGEWELKGFSELDELYPEERKVWHEHFGRAQPTGGESVAEVYERVTKELERIANENPDKTVFIASHGGTLGCVVSRILGIPCYDITKHNIPANASVTVFEIDNGAYKMIKMGDTSHLGALYTTLPANV